MRRYIISPSASRDLNNIILNDDAFLLTAYLTDRIKPGEQLWQQT